MKTQVSIKQIIIDFIYIGKQLKELFTNREDYKPIIEFLLAKDYLNEDLNIPYPKLKDVESATGLKPYTLRKILLKMHSEIFTYERKLNLSFKKVIYHFYIRYFDYRCQFTVDYLTHLPRIGDSISVPFVSALIPINYFYVEDIEHELENNTQIIIITLCVGKYNEYYSYMKDRALELREISFRESYELSEDKIKEIIYSKHHR
ncbi:hypothetical protein DOS84_13030 [Flavobacterium aquariorum]|uniref:Uncharacterized protein n=1 Tax=Flavobacterium aquariorum TaxID=2217670 RepID=A0A2W7TRC8_9FLAO|nr:hypothetical protein [Flavobacterium aquariorum]PZX92791.1 hypothetical protein DOS84_13030 [Flavobacterium aquariorum]